MAAVFAIGAVVVWPNVPEPQVVRLHLGTGSSNVRDVVARIRRNDQRAWDREATWHFERGAPASLPWAFELQKGDVQVEVELTTSSDSGRSRTQDYRLELKGGETALELAGLMRTLDEP